MQINIRVYLARGNQVRNHIPSSLLVTNPTATSPFVSSLQEEIKSESTFIPPFCDESKSHTSICVYLAKGNQKQPTFHLHRHIPFDLAPPFTTNPTAKTTFVIYLARGNHLRKHIRTSLVVTKPTVQPTWVSTLLEEIKCEQKVVPMHQYFTWTPHIPFDLAPPFATRPLSNPHSLLAFVTTCFSWSNTIATQIPWIVKNRVDGVAMCRSYAQHHSASPAIFFFRKRPFFT